MTPLEKLKKEIYSVNEENLKLTKENAELKEKLHAEKIKNGVFESQNESLIDELKEYDFDFNNPHAVGEKLLSIASGTKIENMVSFVNHISANVHETLTKMINRQKEQLSVNQRSMNSLVMGAMSTSKQ